jgi:CRISPR-associated protein Cas1
MGLTKTKTDVIIDENIHHLQIHAGFIRLFVDDKAILADVPVHQIRSILIEGSKINIPAMLIKLCSEYKIPIHVLTNLHKHYGSLHFSADSNIQNRQIQFKVILNDDWRLYLAKQILHQKLLTQQKALDHWGLLHLGEEIAVLNNKIKSKTRHQSLMGLEGTAASLYFQGFAKQIDPENFEWNGRIKYPCIDPINSMLSLAYSLLSTQCQTSLTLLGLDPYLGILHQSNSDRPALVYDIMEVYRVFLVDYWVLALIQSKTFVKSDFVNTQEGVCTLMSMKKNEFFRLWFKRLKYHKFSTNKGQISISEFLEHNTLLLISWLQKIESNKERSTGRFNRLPENLIIFEDITQFQNI